MKLVGLDFETANRNSGSIISIGLAMFDEDQLIEKYDWRIRPHHSIDYMDPFCFKVHGICHEELRNKPEFPEYWDTMHSFLQQADCVTIHNARFDLRHLAAVLHLYDLPTPSFSYICTLALSRKRLKDELSSFTLNNVADYIGFSFKHHDAYEDAAACATVALKLGIEPSLIQTFQP